MPMSAGLNRLESSGRRGDTSPHLEAVRIGLAALAAAGLSLYSFSPRYVLWRLLGTPVTPPELVRAGDALRQLAHPLVHIDSRVNSVLEWRLLFPMLGHLFRLPDAAYLALPHLGALIALGFVSAVARRHGFGWPRTIACATILSTSDWFFVSVGWLGYFDSWCILALLLVVFAQRKWIAMAAILAAPWVDERFVVALPLCLVLRAMPLGEIAAAAGGRINWRQLVELCLALVPWILIRAAFYFWRSDDVTTHHLKNLATANGAIRPISYLAGLWEGARWGWLAVAALVWQNGRAAPRWCAGFILVLAATMAAGLFLAEDLSRSASVAAPAVLLGLLLFRLPSPGAAAAATIAVAGLNLFFPAQHVSGDHRVPILYLPAELNRNRDPLGDFNSRVFEQLGIADAGKGQSELAEQMFDAAISLEPSRPDLWLDRGEIRARRGDFRGAAADTDQSLRRAQPDWPRGAEAKDVIDRIRHALPE